MPALRIELGHPGWLRPAVTALVLTACGCLWSAPLPTGALAALSALLLVGAEPLLRRPQRWRGVAPVLELGADEGGFHLLTTSGRVDVELMPHSLIWQRCCLLRCRGRGQRGRVSLLLFASEFGGEEWRLLHLHAFRALERRSG